jgi:hypothetical protein
MPRCRSRRLHFRETGCDVLLDAARYMRQCVFRRPTIRDRCVDDDVWQQPAVDIALQDDEYYLLMSS